MSGKTKPAEVTSARIRLDATLQHLVDRKEDSHEAISDGESSVPLAEPVSKQVTSPKKSTSKQGRKRKRREDSEEYDTTDEQQTVIMKLFDRSVDLAQFPEDTPLFPVCRAWIQNRPHDKSLGTLQERPLSPKIEEDPDDGCIYRMPPPLKSEEGCLYDLRIPEPLPQSEERLNLSGDPKNVPAPDHLLLEHLNRWKNVRERWRVASVMNEMQYISSMQLLKEMFDRNVDNTLG
ncbi:protein lin-37 homolog isoform X2 [Physella acuta]|uniref:protein lin-37 homolog isoform X2 n=1 Tax=Physella acuta TaxID=109671 RepID=UPI0027DC9551|nr:protein lin-37 homolog isoform X2 [Physella acuta]